MPDNYVDLIVTHPPYFGVDSERYGGIESKQINYKVSRKKFVKNIVKAVSEMYRVIRPGGTVWIGIGTRDGIDVSVMSAIIEKTKLVYVGQIVQNSFDKVSSRSEQHISHTSITMWYGFTKEKLGFHDHDAIKGFIDPVWYLPINNMDADIDKVIAKDFHVLDTMHKDIPSRLIEMFSAPGDFVFDPFGGSGLVAVTAVSLGRVGVTNDISNEQLDAAKLRYKMTIEDAK